MRGLIKYLQNNPTKKYIEDMIHNTHDIENILTSFYTIKPTIQAITNATTPINNMQATIQAITNATTPINNMQATIQPINYIYIHLFI